MTIKFNHWHNPDGQQIGSNFHQLLHHMSGPTVIQLDGEQPDRCRVVVTLLHGNEPSGLAAIHRFLSQKLIPKTRVYFVFASVAAAKTPPTYLHRMLPGHRDLNRCFDGPLTDVQGQLASSIKEYIVSLAPEAIVDVHNTSGSGPAFCVSAVHTAAHLALSSHFVKRTIFTDIRLGSIMEQDFGCPIVTVEAGGAQDSEADENAFCGLKSFLSADQPFEMQQEMEVLLHPRRLELQDGASIGYSNQPNPDWDLTLFANIEGFNFGVTPAKQPLGWLHKPLKSVLKLDQREDTLEAFFKSQNGLLVTQQPLKLFMVTTRADIAASDCLFYFVTD